MTHDGEETIRTSTMNLAAQYLANHWTQFLRPVPYDRVLRVDGIRVRVTVQEHKTPDDTKPIKGGG